MKNNTIERREAAHDKIQSFRAREIDKDSKTEESKAMISMFCNNLLQYLTNPFIDNFVLLRWACDMYSSYYIDEIDLHYFREIIEEIQAIHLLENPS